VSDAMQLILTISLHMLCMNEELYSSNISFLPGNVVAANLRWGGRIYSSILSRNAK